MNGQTNWYLRGQNVGYDDYISNPNPDLEQGVYYQSEARQLFGRINDRREVKTVEQMYGKEGRVIDVGNDSPIWEKDFGGGNGECRFTYEDELAGLPNYGSSDPSTGDKSTYRHSQVFVRRVNSPKYPLMDAESRMNVADVIPDALASKKNQMSRWREKQVEYDAFRTLLNGQSRGMMMATDGGLGIVLPGAAVGQNRSCYNTIVGTATGLTTPNYTRTTHEGTLSTLVNALSDVSTKGFTWDSHKKAVYYMSRSPINAKPVKVGGQEFLCLAIIDPRNIDRLLTYGGSLATAMLAGYARGKDNPVLNRVNGIVLDDVCYIPSLYLENFRPTADGTTMVYMADTTDPLSSSFSNTSNVTMTIYMGAGALLRGRRKKVWFTVKDYDHDTGNDYSVHYYDGWMRNEWFRKDNTTALLNDSSLVMFNYDPGVGKAYAA
jgi:hypothetical protein